MRTALEVRLPRSTATTWSRFFLALSKNGNPISVHLLSYPSLLDVCKQHLGHHGPVARTFLFPWPAKPQVWRLSYNTLPEKQQFAGQSEETRRGLESSSPQPRWGWGQNLLCRACRPF